MTKSHLLGIVCVYLASISGAVSANLIVDGSFESGNLDDWTHSGQVGVTGFYGSTDGSQAAGFNGNNAVSDGLLSQSFSTVIGQTYHLEFDYGVYGTGPFNEQNLVVRLTGAGILLDVSLADTGSNPIEFLTYMYDFTADSTSTALLFDDEAQGLTTVNNDYVLDRVSVTAVPVPATVWLFGSALGLLGWLRRKAT